ncbi:MAG: hypothetical protein WAN65_14335 [Candidatus Sulfotelmatobacter sp.]
MSCRTKNNRPKDDGSQSKHPFTLTTPRERRSYCACIIGSLSDPLCTGFTGSLHKYVFWR